MQQHLQLMQHILTYGRLRRAGHSSAPARSVFGQRMVFNLMEGFPVATTQKVFFKTVVRETLWFLAGDNNIDHGLRDKGCKVWNQWSLTEETAEKYDLPEDMVGSIGPLYPTMWRSWYNPDGTTTDQISYLMKSLKEHPYSRRQCVASWNPGLLPVESESIQDNIAQGRQSLAPCHPFFQFYVEPLYLHEQMSLYYRRAIPFEEVSGITDEARLNIIGMLQEAGIPSQRLSCALYARSQDVPVGTVYNIASYSLLTHMIAHTLGYLPGDYVHMTGDTHIYLDQVPFVMEQLKREPKPLPSLSIKRKCDSIFDYKYEDFELLNYDPPEHIKYPVTE